MKQSVRLSQNFLRNPKLVEQLVADSSIGPDDTVLDIGAGSGGITRALAAKAKHVIAYEADERLATNLVGQSLITPNVEVIMGDFLTSPLPTEPYKVFANIPFNLTSDIVRKLLDGFNPPLEAYLLLQREAALKFMGEARHQTLLATLRGPWFEFDITYEFKPSDFTPQPAVKIVLLHVKQRTESLILATETDTYEDFVSYIYNHANPNILPSLQKLFPGKLFAGIEHALGPKLTAKPSQLELHDWLAMFRVFTASAADLQKKIVAGSASKLAAEVQTIEKHHRTRSAKNWIKQQ